MCIQKIELGINSIVSGKRSGVDVGKDLEYFFGKLESINKPMYEELYQKYCIVRLQTETKELHS